MHGWFGDLGWKLHYNFNVATTGTFFLFIRIFIDYSKVWMGIKLSEIKVMLPGSRTALFQIPSLEITTGEKVLIEGPSGIGKTTLIHLIAGLFAPDDGYVFLGESNLKFLTDDQRCELRRKKVGIIFQNLNLLDHLTAVENITLTATGKDVRPRAIAALRQLNIEALADVRTAALSLGEQQRVAVARILTQSPEVILADEPTSSLDDKNAQLVLQSLLSVPHATLVMVSHDYRMKSHFSRVLDFERWVTP
jgi:ABC-type lipoprotein export system ATPase subunit